MNSGGESTERRRQTSVRQGASQQLRDMASTSTSPSEPSLLEKHITCSICMEAFKDPVSTTCGHSFCKDCLRCNFEYNDMQCPLCKTHLTKAPDVNIVLRDLIQQLTKKDDEAVGPGEVACDVCIEQKLKAKKSCLVCLASYCSTHVKNHYSTKRLKGHKLVEPVENLDARACLTHGRPLDLYSRKRQKCICVRCMQEGQEEVVSTEDEWDKKKTELEDNKTELQDEIKKRKTKVDEIAKALKDCKDVLENDWWDIEGVFTAVIAIMEEAMARMQQPLKERRQLLEKEAKNLNDQLEAEINKLETTISELDDISALEDHVLFLQSVGTSLFRLSVSQSYPSLQDPNNMKDWTEVELDTSLSFGTMRKTTIAMMEKIQQELEKLTSIELKRVPTFTADVKLDPATAHKRLVVSKDGKQVKDGGEDQEVADGPERFDLFGGVLGLDGFTSGRSYWEVEVTNKTGWDLGVARGDANRKGKLKLNPENGYWVTVLYEDKKFAALTAPPLRLSLEKPEKVGVFVDYDEGLVSFYDVTAQSHIYSFTDCSFKDELYPYFSPHFKQEEKNSEPLIISAGKL
ncbi:E3 ubiquitin-protein ligase TRIM39-like isoform X2 [Amphiprion ocellaris]|uniref:E3 ubiquitin-protein ligase TRIM39-like isoform X2 n=1 Tax=Amphiprion ocellaris TaxID=80972 RepID=UPI002411796D|nr:E3 ubiquitin-protein ligase TRIM39-like isoform X2 [Amphiprion ocellaris]